MSIEGALGRRGHHRFNDDAECDSPYDDESLTMPTYADVGGCSTTRRAAGGPGDAFAFAWLFRSLVWIPEVYCYTARRLGKTTLLRAAAYESGAHVEQLNGGDVASKKSGEAEAHELNLPPRTHAPSVVMIDELEAIAQKRDKADSEQDKRSVRSC